MTTTRFLAVTLLLGACAAACTPEPTHVVRMDDTVVRPDDASMTPIDVAMTPGTPVPVGRFDAVQLRGGGHVTLHYGGAERVTLIQGSTQYTQFHIEDGHELVIDACNHDCPTEYHLTIDITMPRLTSAAISGGGHIVGAPGFPTQDALTAAVQGGGDVDLRALDAVTGSAAVDGGGHIHMRVDRHLTAAVNGGGSITYSGAADVTTAINGGGSVRREDGGRG